jgi:choline dehydrogenase-like flavoprotein
MSPAHYDAIVIGSGAGGSATAYRLATAGLRVAMLEKGSHLPQDGSTLDIDKVVHQGAFLSKEPWLDGHGRQITPEEHFNVGGKTKWYGAALLRFADHEFLPDLEHGCLGWPIRAADLAPFYDEAERLLGVRTFKYETDLQRILARINETNTGWHAQPMPMGLAAEITANPREAAHFDGFASAANLKGEAEHSLLSRLRPRENFHLLVNSEVKHLLGAHPYITGVRLADGREIHASRTFLAAGALHSPRLLSDYLVNAGLSTTLPIAAHVGRYLKLHQLTAMVALSPGRKRDLIRKTVFLTHTQHPHSSVQPLGFDGELIGTLMPKLLPTSLRSALGARAYGFFLQTEDGSDTRNRITQDGLRPPVLDYEDTRIPFAAAEHRSFTRTLQRTLVRAGMVSFTRRVGLTGTAHACGSLVCGYSPATSVVDPEGRVHGMQGLYVVDGSVLPRSSRVNPSLTIYAWALRVGDLVVKELQHTLTLPTQEPSHVT